MDRLGIGLIWGAFDPPNTPGQTSPLRNGVTYHIQTLDDDHITSVVNCAYDTLLPFMLASHNDNLTINAPSSKGVRTLSPLANFQNRMRCSMGRGLPSSRKLFAKRLSLLLCAFQTFGIVLPNLLRTVCRIHGCAGGVTILTCPHWQVLETGLATSGGRKNSRNGFNSDGSCLG